MTKPFPCESLHTAAASLSEGSRASDGEAKKEKAKTKSGSGDDAVKKSGHLLRAATHSEPMRVPTTASRAADLPVTRFLASWTPSARPQEKLGKSLDCASVISSPVPKSPKRKR